VNDERIVRVLAGSAGPEEVDALRRWRSEAPANDRYVRALERVWAYTAPPPRRPVPAVAITAAILDAAEHGVDAPSRAGARTVEDASGTKGRGAPTYGRWVGMAAALAAVAAGLGRFGLTGPRNASPGWEAGTAAAITAALPDGTLVRVAPGGRLRTLDSSGERRYALEGSAFFAVAHDTRRPFVVEAGGAVVRVVGTRFEIDRTDARVIAAVVEGRVTVAGPGGSVEVGGGAVAIVDGDGPLVVEHPPDLFARLRRPEDALLFQSTPLERVAEEVGRRFGQPVTVEGDTLRTRTVTGWFGPEGFEEVVGALCAVVGAACSIEPGSAALRPRAREVAPTRTRAP